VSAFSLLFLSSFLTLSLTFSLFITISFWLVGFPFFFYLFFSFLFARAFVDSRKGGYMNADGACHASSNATLFFHAGKGQSARDVGKSDYEYLTGGEDDGGPADLDEDQEKGDSGFMRGAVPISGFMQVPPNQRSLLKMALAEAGPVSVSIDASAMSFYYYTGGVYDAPASECKSEIGGADHIVMLVGYGYDEASGKDYWILRNSWSSHWGEDGYMKIAMAGNTCGVANLPTFPILKN
jgi:hypothetical protein